MDHDLKGLLTYLKSNELMSLATSSDDPSNCIVYYGVDEDFTLYIVTPPSTEHGINIAMNHMVACTITNTNQPMYGTKYKVGVQVKGEAREITDILEMKKALAVWSKDTASTVERYLENIINKTWLSRPYVIKPKEIKWFNEELFGEEGTKTFTF